MTARFGLAFLSGSSVGPLELLFILIAALILLGPKRLPEVARNLGRMLANFKRASDDLKGQIMRMDGDVERDDDPARSVAGAPVIKPAANAAARGALPAVEPPEKPSDEAGPKA